MRAVRRQLFQLDVRYLIPLYQRPYVWTEEQQWAKLRMIVELSEEIWGR